MPGLLQIHIAAGGLAIVLGAVALVVKKGGAAHRRSGMLFVSAMLAMAASASILEFRKTPNWTNVSAALMVGYFVATALTTVRAASPWNRRVDAVAFLVAIGLACLDVLGGLEAYQAPRRILRGVPFPMYFVLATVLALAAFGDLRAWRAGALRGGARLARHLWRMCFALAIAAGSFFSIRSRVARILPVPLTTGPMRALPLLLLFGTMFYWLWRVRRRRAAAPTPGPTAPGMRSDSRGAARGL